jgi:hypothetical protein
MVTKTFAKRLTHVVAILGVGTSLAVGTPAQAGGGDVLPASAKPHGYSLTDMTRLSALFFTSGNDGAYYPETPFQILYADFGTAIFTPVDGGLDIKATNDFSGKHAVHAGTPFYLPLFNVDDSPPIWGTFPTSPSQAARYVFDHNQVGLDYLVVNVDGRSTMIGRAYVAGPVEQSDPPLLDGGGTHIITVGVFLTPLSPGTHVVSFSGQNSGLAFQAATGLAFLRAETTYTVEVVPGPKR